MANNGIFWPMSWTGVNGLAWLLILFFSGGHVWASPSDSSPQVGRTERRAEPTVLSRPGIRSSSAVRYVEIDCLIEPHMVAEVASPISGIVQEIKVERGDVVRKGQVVASLVAETERINVELAKARLQLSEQKHGRMEELFRRKLVTPQAMDEAETEHKLAELELARAMEALNMRTIRSPLSGVVVERFISPGEITEHQKVFKIAQINPLNVEVIAPVDILGVVRVGEETLVVPEGRLSVPLKAKVVIVDRVVDAASGTLGIRLELQNPKYSITPGLKCKAMFARDAVM
jgi:RND family efflux transporter MFP subunit